MDTIAKVDVTTRATDGGWQLPEFWTVAAEISPDYDTRPTDFDCYTPAQVAAWERDEWQFVVVSVFVEDADGREWGRDVLGGVEYGSFVLTDEQDNVTGADDVDPLADKPGEYSVIREHDMIGEALRDAVRQLESFGTPVLREPDGSKVTGL